METYEQIKARLRKKIEEGMTQEELSKETGITQSHISKLLSAKRDARQLENLRLGTFFRLFPNARIDFGDGTANSSDRSVNNCHLNHSQVVTGVNQQQAPTETAISLLRRIMSSQQIDAETKVKIYNIANQEN